MTKPITPRRFLIDRELTPQDIETMNYWCAVRDAEIERGIRVVNNWQKLKQEEQNAKNYY